MADIDLISTYYPALADIPAASIRAARERIVNYLQAAHPELDTRPNTPFGDLYITPAAEDMAAKEVAWGRVLSDLDLQNVADGIVYNCFARETQFVTREGVRSFRDFEPGDELFVLTAAGNWKPATVRSYGQQALQRIHIRRGKLHYHVRATENHRWLLRDGSETTAVRIGNVLQEAPCLFEPWEYGEATPEERVAWAYGYIFGDGTVLRDSEGEPKWSHVRLCGDDKQKFAERFRELGFSESSPRSCRGDVMFATGHYVKEPLSADEPFEVLQAFCRGYMDADAAKNYSCPSSQKRSNRKEYLKIQATGDPHREFIRSIFPVIGQYITYEHDCSGEQTNLAVRGPTSDFGLNNWIYDQAPKFVVEGIEDDGVEEVWCLEVEDDQSFVLPFGLATGNCDFVRAFLSDFAAVPLASVPASGIVRLIFTVDQEYELNRNLQFAFFNDNVTIFDMRLAHDGPVFIRAVRAPIDTRDNQFRLVQLGPDEYAVDIPVTGVMEAPVTAGASAQISEEVECLASVLAVVDFDDGAPEDSLAQIAQRTRQAFHAMTLSSRNGAINLVQRQFPTVEAVSPVMAGDDEMVRDAFNPLGISVGGMDLHIQSQHSLYTVTQQVRLNYYAEMDGEDTDVFVGELGYLHPPRKITSITYAENATIDLGTRGDEIRVFSASSNPDVAPGLLCAFSPLETLYVTVKMPRTSGNLPYIELLFDEVNQAYAWFDVTYIADPILEPAYDMLTSDLYHPAGSRIHVRGFNIIDFTSLTIDYKRRPGTTINLTQARAEIYAYLRGRGGPDFPYSDGPIIDAMYYAGALQVMAIRSDARVRWTCADHFLLPDDALPTVDYNAAVAEKHDPATLYVPNSSAFQPAWSDPNLGTASSLHAAIGPRNTSFLLEEDNLYFNEV